MHGNCGGMHPFPASGTTRLQKIFNFFIEHIIFLIGNKVIAFYNR